MSQKANVETTADYAPLSDPDIREKYTYNQVQKAGKLARQINHKINYGVGIYAQALLKVAALQKELEEMGLPPVEVITPDFSDPEKLKEYAGLSAYKPQIEL